MPNNWTKCKLGDVSDIVGGGTPSTKESTYWGGDIPWLTPKDLSGYMQRYISKGERNINLQGLENSGAKLMPVGTVLFTSRAPIGYVAIARNEIATNQGFKSLVLKENQYPEFYYYFLKYNKDMIEGMASGSTFKEISGSALKDIDILIPEYEEQKRIAGVLGAFDDKIELLQKQNKTLEDMAKAIFKSWFVDFDIVKAKERGEEKQKIISEYKITEELYNLFPSSFTDAPASSSLGPIPTGWEVKQIKDIAILTMGQSPSGNTYNEAGEGLPFYQGRTDFGFRFPSKRVYCSEPTRIAQAHDILISVRAPVGDLNIALERCCIGRGVGNIRSKTSDYSFIYYSLLNIQNALKSFDNEGTVFGSINKDTLSSLKVIYPQQILVNEYDNLTSKLDNKIEANTKQIQTLTELRDGFLPRLLSGKLKV
jgi:type I restriction enzyme S subunit